MIEKFKYGPLVWNHVDENDDSGNYWWPGIAPVDYDQMGIPVDAKGLQCLPMSCPLHPSYEFKYSVFNNQIKDHLPTFEEWKDWFDENFINITETRIKREILRWYVKRGNCTRNFYAIQERAKSLDEMVDLVWPPEENK